MRVYQVGFLPQSCIDEQHLLGQYADGKIHCGTCPSEPVSLNVPEPPPTQGTGPDLWPLVMADLPKDSPLLADMQERHEGGIKKYGAPLRAFNGRNALVDAYQEALDLIVYLRQVLEETPEEDRGWRLYHLLEASVGLAENIKLMHRQKT